MILSRRHRGAQILADPALVRPGKRQDPLRSRCCALLLGSAASAALLVQQGHAQTASSAAPVTFFGEDMNGVTADMASHPNSDQAKSKFFGNLQGVGTETFESIPVGTVNPSISFAGVGTATLTGSGSVQSGVSSSDQFPISGSRYYNAGTTDFSITFSSGISAFGFYGTDIGDVNGKLTLTLTQAGGGTTILTVPDYVGPAADGSALYYGFFNTKASYTGITFGNSGNGDVFGFDDFSVGAVNQVVPVIIDTTDGDVAPNVFSLGSPAAKASTVQFDGGILQMSGGSFTNNIIGAPVSIDSNNGTIDTSTGSGGFSGVVSGPGSLTIKGGGTFALTGSNTYSGGTIVNASTVAVGSNTALGTGTLTLNAGTLQASFEGLAVGNAMVLAGSGTIDTQGFGFTASGVISGPGALTKLGSGSLMLSGANTYAGGTVLTGGTIVVTSGIGTGTLTFNGGTLQAVATAASFAFPNTSGTLQASASARSLTFANAIQVDAAGGTIDRIGISLNLNGNITDGTGAGTLVFANSAGTTTGGVVLSGTNTYSGGSVINTGAAVTLGADNALGSGKLDVEGDLNLGTSSQAVTQLTGQGSISNNAGFAGGQHAVNVLAVQGGYFQGTISDNTPQTIQLVKASDGSASGGTLALTGLNSYGGGTVLKAGTIAIGNSGALGTGALQMADGTTLQFLSNGLTLANAIVFTGTGDPTFDTGSGSETVSGPISGSSSLTKRGSGTLDLTGTDTYTGATTVEAGTLVVDGSIANSTVTVDSGAALGGSGTIGGLIVQGGSVVAPGARTLTINGNLSFAAGSTYQATVNADGTSSRLAVGGTATLGGAALSLVAGSGTFGTTTNATLLTAAGGVTGTFATPTADQTLAFLNPTVTYTPTSVNLALTRNATTLPSEAATSNQTGVATAIAALGPSSPLYNAVVGQTAAGARQAFDATSGLSHSSTERITATTTRLLTGIVVDRLSDVSGNGLSAQQAVDQFGTPGAAPPLVRCYDALPTPPPPKPQSYTAWGEAFGTFGHTDGGANYGTLDRSVGGFVLGIDTPLSGVGIDQWRAGVAGGYSETFYTSHLDGGTGTVQSVYGSLYGGARYGSVDIKVGTTLSGQQTDGQRTVAFPGFFETEKSSNGGLAEQGFGEIGYRIPVSHVVIEPVAGAAILHVHQDGFREAGGIAALVAGATDSTLGTTTLGVRGETAPFQGLPIIAHAFLGWQHLIGNASPATTLAFESAAGNTFSVSGTPLDRNALAAEVSLDYRATAALDVGLTYAGAVGPTAEDHSIKGRVEYRF